MIYIATRIVQYTTPLYECTGRIKLEDPNTDISNTNLFKTFDVFNQPSKIMAEVEVIKSTELLKSTLNYVNFDVSYFRKGKIRTSEMFYESPFIVKKFEIKDEKYYDKNIDIQIIDTIKYFIIVNVNNKNIRKKGYFNENIELEGLKINIKLNKDLLKSKKGIKLRDNYYFIINSRDKQIEDLGKLIDVKELDKDIPIIRVICKNAVPEKAMLITNTLMETYINEGIKLKTKAAKKTVDFIDQQLIEISDKLAQSESELEAYRLQKKITNTKLEVETDLKKVSQLKIQLTNVEMNLASLDTLDFYVNNGEEDFLLKGPNYEGYGGLLYTEFMKRLKELQSEKKELLMKYTPENEKVLAIDGKIKDVVDYIKQNIHLAANSMRIQRDKILNDIAIAEEPFTSVPTKEKRIIILEREFKLNQDIYNFLNEKRTEANIAQSATFSFHRIIQRATLPEKPVSPKKTFTMLVFGFLGLLFSLILIYVYDAISARVKYKDQLEKNSTCPVIGDIRHEKTENQAMPDFFSLAIKLMVEGDETQIITVTSGIDNEGKSFVAERLAKAFAQMQVPVLLVASNLRDKTLGSRFGMTTKKGFSEFMTQNLDQDKCIYNTSIEGLSFMPEGHSDLIPEAIFANTGFKNRLMELKKNYRILIFDSPSFDTSIDSLTLIRLSEKVLFVFRANYTKTKMLIEPDILKQEYNLDNIKLILNDVEAFAKTKKDRGIRKSIQLFTRKVLVLIKLKIHKFKQKR